LKDFWFEKSSIKKFVSNKRIHKLDATLKEKKENGFFIDTFTSHYKLVMIPHRLESISSNILRAAFIPFSVPEKSQVKTEIADKLFITLCSKKCEKLRW